MSYDPYAYGPPPPDPYAQTYGGYAPPPHAGYGHPDEVRTIFITGFPTDVKERELNNLLRFLHGYVASQMNWKSGQPQGFGLFDNGANARAAVDLISQIQFDETTVIRAEMARKNMYIKDDSATKRAKVPGGYAPTGSYPGTYAPAAAAPPAGGAPAPGAPAPQGFTPPTSLKDNPPCNTLFVGNIGDMVSEVELKNLFGSQPGFKQLKLNRSGKNLTCFVEYQDVPTAMAAHNQLQGTVLATSERGGIRVQYSKNPFGKKRDAPDSVGAY